MAIACTQTERDALAAAIKSGIRVVRYSDKTVEYESATAMRAILAEMDEHLIGSAAQPRFSRASFSRG